MYKYDSGHIISNVNALTLFKIDKGKLLIQMSIYRFF